MSALESFFRDTDLSKSFVIGYYGAGNFGDELLLETILQRCVQKKEKDIAFYYSDQVEYARYHTDFGYTKVGMSEKKKLLAHLFGSKNIIIGGGGLWGMDTNWRVFVFFVLVFFSALFFGTRVYAIGVGYYTSTNWFGKIGAWLIARIAKKIIVRDDESKKNFSRFTSKVEQDKDLGFVIRQEEIEKAPSTISIKNLDTPYLVFNREFRGEKSVWYKSFLQQLYREKQYNITSFLGDTPDVNRSSGQFFTELSKCNGYQLLLMEYNPVDIVRFLYENKDILHVIAPQFHIILFCIRFGIPFLPLCYDNKVYELYKQSGVDREKIIYLKDLNNLSFKNIDTYFVKT